MRKGRPLHAFAFIFFYTALKRASGQLECQRQPNPLQFPAKPSGFSSQVPKAQTPANLGIYSKGKTLRFQLPSAEGTDTIQPWNLFQGQNPSILSPPSTAGTRTANLGIYSKATLDKFFTILYIIFVK